ncbi:MAG: ORF6N domain-containing protein [Saprospiraceae bacterium]
MELKTIRASTSSISTRIYDLRGQKVMLDFDLAELYGTETKRLKESVRRNPDRFPVDFVFELSMEEFDSLRTQIATSKRGGIRYVPFAFTKQGVAMLSSVLKSKTAIEVNIAIMRAFVLMRNYALSHADLTSRLNDLESKYDRQFKDVYDAINFLLQKDKIDSQQKARKQIGYKSNKEK